jgi:DnaJ-class molecular chaperone
MDIKNIKEMDYYELLNIKRSASPQEIERAYHLCRSTYLPESIAYYSLITEEERQFIMERIEKAYKTLSNHKRRKLYDFKVFEEKKVYKEKASFRKSTEKLVIEDLSEKIHFWRKIKHLFPFFKKR